MSARLLLLIGCLCVARLAHGAPPPSLIDRIDSESLTISRKGNFTTYRIRPDTVVILNGQPAKVSQLAIGMSVTVSSNDPQVATRIIANGTATPSAPPVPQPVAGGAFGRPSVPVIPSSAPVPSPPAPTVPLPKDGTRELTVKLTVPGADAIKIQDGALWLEHRSAMHHGMPSDITINHLPWRPTWDDRISSRYVSFQPPLASFVETTVSVTKISGRTEIKSERPSAANGYALTVNIADTPVGDGEYVIRIKW